MLIHASNVIKHAIKVEHNVRHTSMIHHARQESYQTLSGKTLSTNFTF